MKRRLQESAYDACVTLYRCLSSAGLVSAVLFFISVVCNSQSEQWVCICIVGTYFSAVTTFGAVCVLFLLGIMRLAFGVLPRRNLEWCILANAVAFALASLSLPATYF